MCQVSETRLSGQSQGWRLPPAASQADRLSRRTRETARRAGTSSATLGGSATSDHLRRLRSWPYFSRWWLSTRGSTRKAVTT
jgi:hypothetical protein